MSGQECPVTCSFHYWVYIFTGGKKNCFSISGEKVDAN